MSATECDPSSLDPDGDSEGGFHNEDNGYVQNSHFEEEEHYPNDDLGKQIEHQPEQPFESPMRHVRPMR